MRLSDPELPLVVAVVGEDPLSRGGLRALLGEAGPLLLIADLLHPLDVADTDLSGVEVLLWDLGIRAPVAALEAPFPAAPPAVVLALDEDDARSALREGASGALARDAAPPRIWAGLLAAAEGLLVLEPRWLPLLTAADPALPGTPSASEVLLSPREQEVLSLLAEGLSNRDIGRALHISTHTAKFHVNAILSRLGAATRTEAVVQAVRLGLLAL